MNIDALKILLSLRPFMSFSCRRWRPPQRVASPHLHSATMPSIRIEYANGKPIPTAKALPMSLPMDAKETIGDVKKSIQRHFPRFPVTRQRLTSASKKVLEDDELVGDLGGDTTLYVKDLGPQISWRTVYIIEYLGPLFIIPAYYFFPQVYGLVANPKFVHSDMQRLVFALVMVHYLKREFETIFVHRFSHATMPAQFLIRNSGHYWGLSGLLLGAGVFGPWYSQSALHGTLRDDPTFLKALTAVWGYAELSNLWTHLTLRSLRPAGSRQRQIPYGYGFNLVSFPNYMFEVLGWACILAMTWDPAVALFFIVGTATMINWGIQKQRKYKKDFGSQYPRRNIIFPFIL